MIEYFQQFLRLQRNARLYLLSNALSGTSAGIFALLYNLYLISLGYHEDFVGKILFMGALGGGLAIVPAGLVIDRWSNKRVLILSNVVLGLVVIGMIFFRQPTLLLCGAFLTGLVGAFAAVINAPFLTRNSLPAERPYLFSLNIFVGQITVVLGEVFGGFLPAWFQHHQSWLVTQSSSLNWLLAAQPEARAYQQALLVAGLLSIPSFIPLFLLSSDPTVGIPARPSAVLSPRDWPWHDWLSEARRLTRPAYIRAFLLTPFFALILVQIFTGMGAGLVVPYFSLFFVHHLHAQPSLFGLIDGAANGMIALTNLCAPWLARRLGRVNSIALTRLCSLPLLLGIGFTTSLPLAVSLYPLRAGTMDMSMGVLQVFSMEVVPERHRGLANSTYLITFQAPWALAAALGGLVIVGTSYNWLFVITACCYLASILTLWGRFGGRKEPAEHQPAILQ